MKLKTRNGRKEVVLKSGCEIIVDLERHHIMLRSDEEGLILWPDNDDKLIAPHCIRTEQDFNEIIDLIAKTHNMNYQKSFPHIRVYRLVK